ncbi:hypothetical protein BT69DRAFT_1322084 [Atractiella rhizophila]|nr:hypothetical protein BT69DRAFT_1322084 [Atractiella rhizophila]
MGAFTWLRFIPQTLRIEEIRPERSRIGEDAVLSRGDVLSSEERSEYTEPSEHSSTTSKRSRPKSHRSISGSGIPRPISPTSTYVSDKSATTISTTSQSSFKSRTVSSVSVSELEEPEGDVRSYHSSLSGSPFDLNRERDSKTPTEYRFTGKEKDDTYTGNGGLSRNNTVTKKNFRSLQSRDQRVFTDPQDFRTQQHEQDSISRKRTTSESAHTLKSSKGRPSISDIVDVHRMRVSTPDYSSTSTCGIKGLTLVDEARMWREREEEEELSQTREMERMERMLASGRRGEELLNGSGRSVSSGSASQKSGRGEEGWEDEIRQIAEATGLGSSNQSRSSKRRAMAESVGRTHQSRGLVVPEADAQMALRDSGIGESFPNSPDKGAAGFDSGQASGSSEGDREPTLTLRKQFKPIHSTPPSRPTKMERSVSDPLRLIAASTDEDAFAPHEWFGSSNLPLYPPPSQRPITAFDQAEAIRKEEKQARKEAKEAQLARRAERAKKKEEKERLREERRSEKERLRQEKAEREVASVTKEGGVDSEDYPFVEGKGVARDRIYEKRKEFLLRKYTLTEELKKNPKDVSIYRDLGMLYKDSYPLKVPADENPHLKTALGYLTQGIRVAMKEKVGDIYAQQFEKEFRNAVCAYRNSLQICDDYFTAWRDLGSLYYQAMDYQDGLKEEADPTPFIQKSMDCLKKAASLVEDDAHTWYQLARVHNKKANDAQDKDSKRDHYKLAEQYYRKAIEVGPVLPSYYLSLGVLYCGTDASILQDDSRSARDTYKLAEAAFQSSLELQPNSTTALYNLAQLYEYHLGSIEQARETYSALVELDPEHLDGKQKLKKVTAQIALRDQRERRRQSAGAQSGSTVTNGDTSISSDESSSADHSGNSLGLVSGLPDDIAYANSGERPGSSVSWFFNGKLYRLTAISANDRVKDKELLQQLMQQISDLKTALERQNNRPPAVHFDPAYSVRQPPMRPPAARQRGMSDSGLFSDGDFSDGDTLVGGTDRNRRMEPYSSSSVRDELSRILGRLGLDDNMQDLAYQLSALGNYDQTLAQAGVMMFSLMGAIHLLDRREATNKTAQGNR